MSDEEPNAVEIERVIPTDVPGIVIWQGPRRTFTKGETKKRARSYSLTHEPSGYALLPGTNGAHKVVLRLAEAKVMVEQLGDVTYRRRPFDWTQPMEAIWRVERARWACMTLAGWRMLLEGYDKATREWADRNGIDLDWFTKQSAFIPSEETS